VQSLPARSAQLRRRSFRSTLKVYRKHRRFQRPWESLAVHDRHPALKFSIHRITDQVERHDNQRGLGVAFFYFESLWETPRDEPWRCAKAACRTLPDPGTRGRAHCRVLVVLSKEAGCGLGYSKTIRNRDMLLWPGPCLFVWRPGFALARGWAPAQPRSPAAATDERWSRWIPDQRSWWLTGSSCFGSASSKMTTAPEQPGGAVKLAHR